MPIRCTEIAADARSGGLDQLFRSWGFHADAETIGGATLGRLWRQGTARARILEGSYDVVAPWRRGQIYIYIIWYISYYILYHIISYHIISYHIITYYIISYYIILWYIIYYICIQYIFILCLYIDIWMPRGAPGRPPRVPGQRAWKPSRVCLRAVWARGEEVRGGGKVNECAASASRLQ